MMAGNDLPKCEANYAPLTPITFLQRSAAVFPDRLSVIYGDRRFTWAQTLERSHRIASALSLHGISPGSTVSIVAPNIPAMYEMHFAVPMAGCVINTINYRLDARTISVLLHHSEAKVVFVDTEFLPVVHEALWVHFPRTAPKPFVVHIRDEAFGKFAEVTAGEFGTYLDYEALVRQGDPLFPIRWPKDEWDSIAINYASGTTAAPKGVVFHHRGAYLNALAAVMDWNMDIGAVYLWSLPMFHCNGWCFTWCMAANAGTNVCLRYVIPKAVFDAIHQQRVTHLGGAPTVLTMLANAAEHERKPLPHKVNIMTGAGPPAAIILSKVEALGFSVIHAYGLTESFGPSVLNIWKEEWDALPSNERAETMARQGDLGVLHPDGYLQLKDRSKDIIISGGENISSIEVESILFTHPQVLEVSVVARYDDFWGETPCAFITLKTSATSAVTESSIIEWCKQKMPRYMIPRSVVFGPLPKTSTGKVQKNVLREQTKKLASIIRPKSKL